MPPDHLPIEPVDPRPVTERTVSLDESAAHNVAEKSDGDRGRKETAVLDR
jgi:hypothetical protein